MKKNILTYLFLIIQTSLFTQNINGIWQQEGYGRILEINTKRAILYDICKIDCTKNTVIPRNVLFNEFKFNKTSDSTLIVQEGITKYYFKKTTKIPAICLKKNNTDAMHNFETLWQTFYENYAYFKERNINWNILKTTYKSQINNQTTPFDLFIIMDKLLNEFNDGHTQIYIPKKLTEKYEKRKHILREKRKVKILDSLGKNHKLPSINVDKLRLQNIKNYVGNVKTYNFGVLNYGLINSDIALVQINGMSQYANYNIPTNISKNKAEKIYTKNANKSKNYSKDEQNGTVYIINKIISEIENTKTCIIDLRFNDGGHDEVQLEILKRFATKETFVFSKKAKTKNGFTIKQPIYVKPKANAYKGKVYILTSHQTASAAEDFTLGTMSAIPNAIRIGSNTAGIFSDILEKKLPNGWEYGFSNEIYESPNAVSYEVIGIQPHYKIDYPKKQYWFYKEFYDHKDDKDAAIEKVFELENL